MTTHYAIVRASGEDTFVAESTRYETPTEFIERISDNLIDAMNKRDPKPSVSIEFIFE